MKRIIKFLVLGVVALVFVGTLVFLYRKSQTVPVVYQLDSPAKMTIIKKTVATGKVIPRREIEVKSQVSGVVDKLFVVAGQVVKKGAILARISLRPNMLNVSSAEAQVAAARINLRNQAADIERYKQLLQTKVISESQFNQYVTNYDLQKQAVASAEDTLLLLKTGATKDSANVSNLIPATIDGTVLDVPNKEGAFILETSTFQSGTTLATLADMNDMIFEGLVDESEVGKLKQGMELILNVGALEGKPFKATLEFIAPKGVTDQGTIKFTIRAAVKLDQDLFLRSNYSANADIVLDKRADALAINESNLLIENKATFVEVETAPQKFDKREIKTGLSDGINIEVISGLKPEEKIKHR
ncbi:MAG TPA: efflux RND transporter periplasmic adaptor subunit [Steroidobacteraceae bacterium]|jgi:HlyD family secretion protein|nr:efflux RND transporter periplasmic adaptor subunit [Steroidobacteraceae bacterium]